MGWNLSLPDWEARMRAGLPLVPDLPLFQPAADRAVAVFDRLKLADVMGTPRLGAVLPTDPAEQEGDACGEWFRAIVRALGGSWDPVSRQRLIREVFLLVPKKNSKALALDTLIATPAGFTTMGAVDVGDDVLGADGKPTRVIAKSQVFTGRKCYEVEFSTGEKVVCDAEHLWVTDAHTDRQKQKTRKVDNRKAACPTVKTTEEIAKTLTVKSGRLLINNHRTALCGPLELPDQQLPIHPYVLGVWLGDGTASGAAVTAGSGDADHIVAQLHRSGHAARVVRKDPRSNAVTISIAEEGSKRARLPYRFRTEAVKLGVLNNKHIPQIYLRGSREQRLQLLQGLMDTDGSISTDGQAAFTTTSPALRDGAIELINSVGLKAICSESRASLNGRDCGPCWRVQFWPFDDLPVFTMPRKLERQRPARLRGTGTRSMTRQIVAVREVPSVPTQCIAVDNESRQYLVTRSLVPTHNTSYSALLMLTMLLLNVRPRAPFILTAPVQDTADLAFSQIAGAVELDDVLKKKLHVRDHLKTIVHRETQAELEIVTFDPKVVTGKKYVGGLLDEIHLIAKNTQASKALRQIRGGMLPFPEAFLVMNTTQSEEAPVGIMKSELQKARDVRDGKLIAPILPVLYEFPKEMQEAKDRPWRDPANWAMVTPNVDRSITIQRLVEECAIAERGGDAELRGWASQHLNIQIGLALQSDGWPGAEFWERQADASVSIDEMLRVCEVIAVGIDGGGNDDLYGFSAAGRTEDGRILTCSRAWALSIVLERRKDIAEKLRDLEHAGELRIVERIEDAIAEVVQLIERIDAAGLLGSLEEGRRRAIGVDPSGIKQTLEALNAAGYPDEQICGVSQGWRLGSAIKSTELYLSSGVLWHAPQLLMDWCVGNAKQEPKGNAILITKQASGSAKIDPLMSLFSALEVLSRNPAVTLNVYEALARQRMKQEAA